MKHILISMMAAGLMLLPSQKLQAVEVLTIEELDSHCKVFPTEPTSLDGEFCARYIQGFIDGAVATDARVMLSVEAEVKKMSSFTERAINTRAPNRSELMRAARYAKYCLGDPVPLKEVVLHVVDELKDLKEFKPSDSARELVYSSLKKYYPCSNE